MPEVDYYYEKTSDKKDAKARTEFSLTILITIHKIQIAVSIFRGNSNAQSSVSV
jgi:hypothetical protein